MPDLAFSLSFTGVDTGFPVGGAANSWGAPTYKLAGFSQKLHEIKKILVHGGAPGAPPLDPPLFYVVAGSATVK